MNTVDMIKELRGEAERHKNDKVFTGANQYFCNV